MRLIFLVFFYFIFLQCYSQKVELSTDSLNNIVYNQKIIFKKSKQKELFNYSVQYIHSILQKKYPIIRNDTITFSHFFSAYLTEYGGLTNVGLIKCKVIAIIEDKSIQLILNNFFYIDYETKDAVRAEEIYTKKVFPDKWHCLIDIDDASKEFIENYSSFVRQKTNSLFHKYNDEAIKLNNENKSAGEEFIIASKRLQVGCLLTTIGTALTVFNTRRFYDNTPFMIVGLITMSIGITFTINGTAHIRKAGFLMEQEKVTKKTSLLFKYDGNRIGLVYNF